MNKKMNKKAKVTLILQLHTLQNSEPPQSITYKLNLKKIIIIAIRLL